MKRFDEKSHSLFVIVPQKEIFQTGSVSDLTFGFIVSGCSFGGRFYSLEDTWHPDLGEPFGVMHCVMCHCEPVRHDTNTHTHTES